MRTALVVSFSTLVLVLACPVVASAQLTGSSLPTGNALTEAPVTDVPTIGGIDAAIERIGRAGNVLWEAWRARVIRPAAASREARVAPRAIVTRDRRADLR